MRGSPLRKKRRSQGLHKPRKRMRDRGSVPPHPAIAAALEAKFDREMIRRIKKMDANLDKEDNQ